MLTFPRLLAISLLLFSNLLQASPAPYGGIDLAYNRLNIGDASFTSPLARINGGIWLFKGIGIEAMLGGALQDDKDSGLTLNIPVIGAAYARFQSPQDLGMKAYVLLGYSQFKMEGSVNHSNFPGKETFSGPAAAVGLLHALDKAKQFSLYLELAGYFAHDELDFGGLALGVRYGY